MKQHYLPECYLREFCNADGKLHTLDLNLRKYGRRVFDEPRYPASVCRSKDFYTISPEMAKGDPSLAKIDGLFLEREFAKYESKYPALIAKLKAGQSYLDRDDVDLLLYFILSFKLRNPIYRNLFSDNKDQIILDTMAKAREMVISWPDGDFEIYGQSREEFLTFIDQKEGELLKDDKYAEKTHLSSLLKKSGVDNAVFLGFKTHLVQFQWVLFRSDAKFVTSDNPGFSMDEHNRVLNTRFDDRFFYFLPLTPSHCFSVSSNGIDNMVSDGDGKKHFIVATAPEALIKTINIHHQHHLSQYLFAGNSVVIEKMAALINAGITGG